MIAAQIIIAPGKVSQKDGRVEGTTLSPPLDRVVRPVDFINWDSAAHGSKAGNNCIAALTDELLPGISPAIAGVDVAGSVVDKKDPKVAITVFPSCDKESRIFAKLDKVVELQEVKLDRAHGTPPFNDSCSASPAGVIPGGGDCRACENNNAANPKPATVSRISSWVNLVKLIGLVELA